MSSQQRHKALNIILVAIAITLLLAAGAGWWLNRNYKTIIKQKLPQISAKATDSLYQIFTGDVDIDLPGRSVRFKNLELIPNPQHLAKLRKDYRLPGLLFKITIPSLRIEGISWRTLLADRRLECDTILAQSPVIRITKLDDSAPPEKEDSAKTPQIEAILAAQVHILNPDIAFINTTKGKKVAYEAKGGGIWLRNWKFELDGNNDTTRLLYAKRSVLRFNQFKINDEQAEYNIGTGAIGFEDSSGNMQVADLRISPALTRAQFYKKVGYQKEIYDVHFPQIALRGLNWQRLMYGGALVARGGKLANASIIIYMDRVPPPNLQSKNGKFPHQMLRKLALPISIPKLDVVNGRFAYTERNQRTMQEGTIAMDGINGAVTNITNIPAEAKKVKNLAVKLGGRFKGSAIKADFLFPLDAAKGAFTVEGSMNGMDGRRMNDITKPLALAEMRELNIQGVQFKINGSEAGATGDLTMRYTGLHVGLLKPEDGKLDKQSTISFLANHLFIFRDNPIGSKDLRTAHPVVQRDATKSFFNLIWKTIFTGMLQTASRKLVPLDKMVTNKQQKQEEERKGEGKGRK